MIATARFCRKDYEYIGDGMVKGIKGFEDSLDLCHKEMNDFINANGIRREDVIDFHKYYTKIDKGDIWQIILELSYWIEPPIPEEE
ncbi:MAG: hypothetical protein LBR73_08355 [Oscillospiraceae bacterium]|jgi:hypothetical protein|nr:hypothetical protein [Oscillospiraceae bacterium]